MQSTSLIVTFVTLCFVGLITAGKYDGYKVFDVTPRTVDQVRILSALATEEQSYDIFQPSRLPGQKCRILVSPQVQDNFLNLLQQQNMSFVLFNANFGQTLHEQWVQNQLLRKLSPYAGQGRLGTDRYYSHGEINDYIEDLAKRYSHRVYVKTVGKSFEQRLMKTITITNGDGRGNKNVVFMDGGFHAREWISPATAIHVISELVENFNENAELLRDYDWVVLPVVNPDGYEYTQESAEARTWRKTRQPWNYEGEVCIGTDPNRNFDFHWMEEGASSNPCSNTFAGPRPFSEPEAVVVRDLLHTLKDRGIMYLTLHSYGSLILYPWGYIDELPDTWEDLDEVAMVGADAIKAFSGTEYTVGSSTQVLYAAAGASDDYAFQLGFPISYTMELPRGGDMGFDPPPSSIDPVVKESWAGIRAMAVKLNKKYPLSSN